MFVKSVGYYLLLFSILNLPCEAMDMVYVDEDGAGGDAGLRAQASFFDTMEKGEGLVYQNCSFQDLEARGRGGAISDSESVWDDSDGEGLVFQALNNLEVVTHGALVDLSPPLHASTLPTSSHLQHQHLSSSSPWRKACVMMTALAGAGAVVGALYAAGAFQPLSVTPTAHPELMEDDFKCLPGYGFVNTSTSMLYNCVGGVLEFMGEAFVNAPCRSGLKYLTEDRRHMLLCGLDGSLNGTWWETFTAQP